MVGGMTTTSPSSRPDPTRSGAVWVTGMGAFLLLAAAAVFTAVRWDQIPDAAKLAALVAATGGCLVASRGLRSGLPATAGALLHLGTFLVPIDVAAVGVRADLDWAAMLLAQGIVATLTFGVAAVTERSVVLRWAFGASAVALAGGIGATTALPAPVVLSAFAVGALVLRRHDAAVGWAAVAGVAPLLTFLDRLELGAGTFERLGLVGDQPRAAAVLTGGLAAAVLAVAGRRRDDVGLTLLGASVAAIGGVASWTGVQRDPSDTLVGLAVTFLVLELAAWATRRDAFWSVPAKVVAGIAEIGAHVATAGLLIVISLVPIAQVDDARVALGAAVLALGWVTADQRRVRGRTGTTIGMATAIVGSVALATSSPVLVAAALIVVAAGAVFVPRIPAVMATGSPLATRVPTSGFPVGVGVLAGWGSMPRPGAHLVAVAASIVAPLTAVDASTTATVLAGIAGTFVLTEAAVRRSWAATDAVDVSRANRDEGWAWVLAVLAVVPGAIAVAAFVGSSDETAIGLIGAAVVATVIAAQADRGRTTSPQVPLGTVGRLQAVTVLAATGGLPAREIGLVALVVAVLSGLDAVRLRRPEVALGAALALPVAIGTLCHAAGLSLPTTGVALTVGAAVIAGLGSQLGARWSLPVGVALTIAIGSGLGLAAGDATAMADAVIVVGGIGLAAAIAGGRLDGVFLAGAVITGGTWLRLADGGIGASEPYLLPVTVLLLIAGLRARSIGTSSWIAYGPLVGLLGGSALLERMAGGAGWHGIVAGAVGVVAVGAGGARRLAAPLLLGSGLLVTLVGYETLAITSSLPTWVWLAAGGIVLLSAGVMMERNEVGPLESGRRLVDTVTDRYA